ncbi:hypothetical protein OI69_09375 [Pectobacterium fontis]|uniref:Uncharacterized protein n=1 Tax=Pectobacterium fontis TaxID=2558042 RepID=A0A7V8L5A4_9GAMM|nr:hypothetical protein OI69_09375 [Pectobacterium fontis]
MLLAAILGSFSSKRNYNIEACAFKTERIELIKIVSIHNDNMYDFSDRTKYRFIITMRKNVLMRFYTFTLNLLGSNRAKQTPPRPIQQYIVNNSIQVNGQGVAL